jgi:hypothetical protein
MLIFVVVTSGVSFAAESCVDRGLQVFRDQGPRAAVLIFEQQLKRRACRSDAILQLNYARTLKAVADAEGDSLKTCRAAEVFIMVQAGQGVGDSIRSLAADGATEVLDRCTAVAATFTNDEYASLTRHASGLARQGEHWLSVIEWKVALRLNDARLEAHRALCKLLPSIGLRAEGETRCASWRALVAEGPTNRPRHDDSMSRRTEWVLTASAASLLIAGGVSYALAATAHSDLLESHRRAIDARDAADEEAFAEALDERSNFESKMGDLQMASYLLIGSGVVVGGVAAYLWLNDDDVDLTFSGNHIGVVARW